MSPRAYASARGRILDAAERVILRHGLRGLSVDAVVRECRLSKGGFFHHFPSKEDLLAAIIERLAAVVAGEIEERAARDRHPRGRRLRAQVSIALDLPPAERDRLRALVLALIAATLEGKSVAAGARAANDEALASVTADGVPLGRALVIQLALDGYFLGAALGTLVLDARRTRAFRRALIELTTRGGSTTNITRSKRR